MKKFYKSRRYRKLKRSRLARKTYKIAKRVVKNSAEWKMTFDKENFSFSSATGVVQSKHWNLIRNIAQGDQKWADVSAAAVGLRDGNSIMGKAIFIKLSGYIAYSGLTNNTRQCIRIIVWEPKKSMDIDDAYTYMTTAPFTGQMPTGNPMALATAYVDPDQIRVHADKYCWMMNDSYQSRQFIGFKKMIKIKRANTFHFQGNAGTVPRNRQLFLSIYFLNDGPLAVAPVTYISKLSKFYFKDV